MPKINCCICDIEFYIRPSSLSRSKNTDRLCCGMDCSKKERSRRMTGEGNHQYGLKGECNGTYKSDVKMSNYGYLLCRAVNHPYARCDGFVLAHRLIFEENAILNHDFDLLEEVNGRLVLRKDVDIHHIDENKTNNNISNLLPTTRSLHSSHHNMQSLDDIERDVIGRFTERGFTVGGSIYKHHSLDAGLDVSANCDCVIPSRGSIVIGTGMNIGIPKGCVGLLWSRSGLSVRHKIEVGAGCIDSGFTGELKVHLYNHGDTDFNVSSGDRIAQLLTIPININKYMKVESIGDTVRGSGGFGSTGV